MKRTAKNLSLILSVILVLSMLLSSCGIIGNIFGGGKEEESASETDVKSTENNIAKNARKLLGKMQDILSRRLLKG